MAYIDDEELQRLKRERPMTGNDTIDGYNIGFEAGVKYGVEQQKRETDMYRGWYTEHKQKQEEAEKERDKLKAENGLLKSKVKKLKKKIKGGF